MHLTRAESSKKLQIPRKGSKYVARPFSHLKDSVTIVAAVRDLLNLAKTASEVQKMIWEGKIKVNGRKVKDYRDTIQIFNTLEAGKLFSLSILPTHKFYFKEISEKDSKSRLCKVTNKRLVKSGVAQLNLHDGTNVLIKSKSEADQIKNGDSVYLSLEGKIVKHTSVSPGREIFVFLGSNAGKKGKIIQLDGENASIKLEDRDEPVSLPIGGFVVI